MLTCIGLYGLMAYADFAGSPLNHVSHQAIQPNAGQHERDQPEEHRQIGNDDLLAQRAADLVR